MTTLVAFLLFYNERYNGDVSLQKPNNKLTPEIITLHRYFIWADRMKVHFDQVLRKTSSPPATFKKQNKNSIDTFLYMSLWYGTFYVVIEGWQKLQLSDPRINKLLKQEENVKLLKLYRHGVFHFQKKYMGPRFTRLMTEGQGIAVWIRELRDELSRWFIDLHNEKFDSSS
jgi:hypothetical protein